MIMELEEESGSIEPAGLCGALCVAKQRQERCASCCIWFLVKSLIIDFVTPPPDHSAWIMFARKSSERPSQTKKTKAQAQPKSLQKKKDET